jgi:hypothetical protein
MEGCFFKVDSRSVFLDLKISKRFLCKYLVASGNQTLGSANFVESAFRMSKKSGFRLYFGNQLSLHEQKKIIGKDHFERISD